MGKKLASEDAVKDIYGRIYEITGYKTQSELAHFLNVQQSSISDAKKRKSIPADWLLKLLLEKHVNPEWILTGNAPRFLFPNEKDIVPAVVPCDCPKIEDFTIEDLLKEVSKRMGKSVSFSLTISIEHSA